jgi:polysaccharide pyruvyl transferase WcaK-like protein
MMRIGLMGPFGGNLGDAATQQAMLQQIQRRLPNAQLYGFSLYPDDTEQRHHIPSFAISRVGDTQRWWLGNHPNGLLRWLYGVAQGFKQLDNPYGRKLGYLLAGGPLELVAIARAYQTLGNLDCLVISGGGQLDDAWGGPWAHPYTLLLWTVMAKLRGIAVWFVSVGAGPLNSRLSRLFCNITLRLADYRSYRKRASQDYLVATLGTTWVDPSQDPVYPDLAYSLQPQSRESTFDWPKPNQTNLDRMPIVGVGPIPYGDPRIWPQPDGQAYQAYITHLADFLSQLLSQRYRLLFFVGEENNDRRVIADLKTLLQAQNPKLKSIEDSQTYLMEPEINSTDDLISQLSQLDVAIACRFHGVLLSNLLCKPVIAVSYHPKITNLMADTGQADYCLPIDSFDSDQLMKTFRHLEVNRDSVTMHLSHHLAHYRALLDEQYDHLFGCPQTN